MNKLIPFNKPRISKREIENIKKLNIKSNFSGNGEFTKQCASWLVEKNKTVAKESVLLKLSCDKALKVLGWKSVFSFDETMQMTALWYKSFYENKKMDMLEFSFDQIKIYEKKAKKVGLSWAK